MFSVMMKIINGTLWKQLAIHSVFGGGEQVRTDLGVSTYVLFLLLIFPTKPSLLALALTATWGEELLSLEKQTCVNNSEKEDFGERKWMKAWRQHKTTALLEVRLLHPALYIFMVTLLPLPLPLPPHALLLCFALIPCKTKIGRCKQMTHSSCLPGTPVPELSSLGNLRRQAPTAQAPGDSSTVPPLHSETLLKRTNRKGSKRNPKRGLKEEGLGFDFCPMQPGQIYGAGNPVSLVSAQ